MFYILIVSVYLLLVINGCTMGNAVTELPETSNVRTDDSRVQIRKHDSDVNITSFQANVKEYRENTQDSKGKVLKEEFKLSYKLIKGGLYIRIDFPLDSNGYALTTVSSPDEMIIFNRIDNTVQYRFAIPKDDQMASVPGITLFGRVAIGEIKTEFAKLGYKMTENPETGILAIEVPEEICSKTTIAGSLLKSEIMYFDTKLEVLCGCDLTKVDKNNVTCKTEEKIFHQLVDNIPIKTGNVYIDHYCYPELAGAPDSFNRDYTVTTTTQYESIDLNFLDDSYFLLGL